MDMNFPHETVDRQNEKMIDLNAIRSSIIANASARQAASETARKLMLSVKATIYSRKVQSQTAMKARILFFAQNENDDDTQFIANGSFYPQFNRAKEISRHCNGNYENGVNLNGSNNVKSNSIKDRNGQNDEAIEKTNHSINQPINQSVNRG